MDVVVKWLGSLHNTYIFESVCVRLFVVNAKTTAQIDTSGMLCNYLHVHTGIDPLFCA